jgi:hypothetical protein
MGLWQHVISEEVQVVEATEDVAKLLADTTLEDCFSKANWPRFVGIAEVEPDGDLLPVRARYGETWNIGLNPYHSGPQWYAIPDLVASKVLKKKVPKVLKAYKFVPVGIQRTLRPVNMMGVTPIDPCSQDFFRVVIEERRKVKKGMPPYQGLTDGERETLQLFLKTLANSGSYGIYLEVVPDELQKAESLRVYSNSQFDSEPVIRYERPGRYFFAPLATMIASAARLMLATLERSVYDAGGVHVLSDTDSMMVIADKEHRTIRIDGAGRNGKSIRQEVTALSWDEVSAIVERFASLNPYDRTVVGGSILEVKDSNFDENKKQRRIWCYAISSKRYCLFDDDKSIVEFKESGIGFLLNPIANDDENSKLARAFYEAIIRGESYSKLEWALLPCVRQLALSTANVLRSFDVYNRGKSYDQRIKPSNFLMTVSIQSEYLDKERVRLIAPLETDPLKWWQIEWLNLHEPGEHWQLSDEIFGVKNRRVARPKMISEFLTQYLWHPEHPFLGLDGLPCGEETEGVLHRRPVARKEIQVVGKSGIDIDEAEYELIDANERSMLYQPDNAEARQLAIAVLRDIPQSQVAKALLVNIRQVNRWLSSEDMPRDSKALIVYAVSIARSRLTRRTDTLSDIEVLQAYEEWRGTMLQEWVSVSSAMSSREIQRALNVNGTYARKLRGGCLPSFQTLLKWRPALATIGEAAKV